MITMNKKGHKNQAERSSRRLWITLLFFCFTVTGFMQAANGSVCANHCHSNL